MCLVPVADLILQEIHESWLNPPRNSWGRVWKSHWGLNLDLESTLTRFLLAYNEGHAKLPVQSAGTIRSLRMFFGWSRGTWSLWSAVLPSTQWVLDIFILDTFTTASAQRNISSYCRWLLYLAEAKPPSSFTLGKVILLCGDQFGKSTYHKQSYPIRFLLASRILHKLNDRIHFAFIDHPYGLVEATNK